MEEKYFVALTDNNGYHWITFLCRPEDATADNTGFIAVGESFDNSVDAEAKAKVLNLMFS